MYPGFLRSMSKGSKDTKNLSEKHLSQTENELLSLADMLFHFRESLKKFSYLCSHLPACGNNPIALKDLHESLGEVLGMIKKVVDKYPATASQEMFTMVNTLVRCIQSCQMSQNSVTEITNSINRLAGFFSKSIQKCLFSMSDVIEVELNSKKLGHSKISSQHHEVFGVELDKHLSQSKDKIPFLVTMCIKEVEENGIYVKGIYRVSAVKSKVNQLCDNFGKFGSNTDFMNTTPHIVANVLKLYLRQLPQPLFTFELYPEFMRVAKTYAGDLNAESNKRCCDELRRIICKLPVTHYMTACAVMLHLYHISEQSEINNMDAYNLAVIFGPTLLHCVKNAKDASAPGSALYDNTYQIRAIELMILSATNLFKISSSLHNV